MRDVEIPETIQRAVWELGAGIVMMPPIIKQERMGYNRPKSQKLSTVTEEPSAAARIRQIIESKKGRIPQTSKRDFVSNVISIYRNKHGFTVADMTLKTAAYAYIKKKGLDLFLAS